MTPPRHRGHDQFDMVGIVAERAQPPLPPRNAAYNRVVVRSGKPHRTLSAQGRAALEEMFRGFPNVDFRRVAFEKVFSILLL